MFLDSNKLEGNSDKLTHSLEVPFSSCWRASNIYVGLAVFIFTQVKFHAIVKEGRCSRPVRKDPTRPLSENVEQRKNSTAGTLRLFESLSIPTI